MIPVGKPSSLSNEEYLCPQNFASSASFSGVYPFNSCNALQELNGYTPEKLAEDAKFWGHKYSSLLKEDGFPTGITSRYPISNLKKEIDGYHHGMLSCKTRGIQIYNIHFHPGHWEIRHREVDLLLKTLSSFGQTMKGFSAVNPLPCA